MKWYGEKINIDDRSFTIIGTLEDSVVRITVNDKVFFEKPINMWAYQEILAEDVLRRYEGKVRKIEQKIPDWIKSGKI